MVFWPNTKRVPTVLVFSYFKSDPGYYACIFSDISEHKIYYKLDNSGAIVVILWFCDEFNLLLFVGITHM